MVFIALAVGVVTGPANSFVFVTQRRPQLSGDTQAAMVVVASVFGLSGLLLGRLADRFGSAPNGCSRHGRHGAHRGRDLQRIQDGIARGVRDRRAERVDLRAGGRGTRQRAVPDRDPRLGGGMERGRQRGRGRVGLLVFGAVADVGNRFAVGAVVTFLPVVLATGLFLLLPETRGREPEDFWPGPSRTNGLRSA